VKHLLPTCRYLSRGRIPLKESAFKRAALTKGRGRRAGEADQDNIVYKPCTSLQEPSMYRDSSPWAKGGQISSQG